MKNKIVFGIIIVISLFIITGCGNKNTNNQKKEDSSKTQNADKNVVNGVISCISPYGSKTEENIEDTTIENSIVIKHVITEINTYDDNDEYKKQCEIDKNMESTQWENYENDKVNCDDSSKKITHTKTYIKDENLTEIYNIKKYTNSDGTFNSKGYIEELEEYNYICTIK